MDISILLSIMITSIFTVNFPLIEFLGTGAVLESEHPTRKNLFLGLGTTVVLFISSVITWPIDHFLLVHAPILKNIVFVAVIMATVELIHLLDRRFIHAFDGVDFTKFAINGAVLGLCLHATHLHFMTEYPYLEVLITSIAVGVGFTLALVLCSSLNERVDRAAVPNVFRGFPIQLLTAGMVALAFLCITR